jgi:PAS domain S-box-containing protein
VTAIRDAIRESRSVSVTLLNYKKDGTPFWNLFHLSPVADDAGRTVWYVGVQMEVSAEVAAELCALDSGEGALAPPGTGEDPMPRTCPVQASQTRALTALLARRAAADCAAFSRSSAASSFSSLEGLDTPDTPSTCAGTPRVVMPLHGAPATAEYVNPGLLRSLVKIQTSFCLADPALPDCPIVHASQGFLDLTGYPPEEVLGRSCRFLQGPATDRSAVAALAAGIRAAQPVTQRLLNYKKNGSPFWNSVHVTPVRDASGAVVLFAGVQIDVSADVAAEAAAEAAALDAAVAAAEGGDAAQVAAPAGGEPARSPARGVPPAVTQLGAVGAVRVAVRGLKTDALLRHCIDE